MTIPYDICIVGSGVTGSLVADHFVRRGLRVVMLDRGGEVYFPEQRSEYWHEKTQPVANHPGLFRNYWPGAEKHFPDLVEAENAQSKFAFQYFQYNMKYGIGGSGAVWSGMAWRLLPEDFRTRSLYGYGRDWPIQYEDLAPRYDKVEQLFHTSGPKDWPDWPWRNNYRYDAFKMSYLDQVLARVLAPVFRIGPSAHAVKNRSELEGGCIGSKTCVPKCPQNARFRPDFHFLPKLLERPNFTLLGDTPCLGLNVDRNKAIASVSVLVDGKADEIRAKSFFLCANTIENLRILLHSPVHNGGRAVANSSGLLGHGFASHGGLSMRITTDEPLYPGRGRPSTACAIDTLRHSERERMNAYMLEVWNSDWRTGLNPGSRLLNIRRRDHHWGRSLLAKVADTERQTGITLIYEIEMRDRNRVELSATRKDRFGLPIARVDFKFGSRDRRTFEYLREVPRRLEALQGVERIEVPGYGINGNHPMGGYRAGDDPRDSVVDRRLRSHDHPNLYILGGGVYNSTGALNPTLTIAALTLWALDDERFNLS